MAMGFSACDFNADEGFRWVARVLLCRPCQVEVMVLFSLISGFLGIKI